MKYLSLIVICFSTLFVEAQSNFQMFASMDGSIHLTQGNTNIWGYGFIGDDDISLPSPLLRIPKGDEVNIEMTNISGEAHTIHLHGLDVDQLNDGVPQTSFYVFPDETANYTFNANNEGTYLYHCHVTTTLHLTMGMYGMIVVEAPDNQVYEGGPVYDSSFEYLMSDLEVATNSFPLFAFPFHEIKPDYFMVNGDSGYLLSGLISNAVQMNPGEQVLLRLGSMAYSKIEMLFPESFHAVVLMSDGRVLPEEVPISSLEIYPGERFCVMLNPEPGFPDELEVAYYNMINNEYLSSNYIPVIDLSTSMNDLLDGQAVLYPNPSSDHLYLSEDFEGKIQIINYQGRVVLESELRLGMGIDLTNFEAGSYILKAHGLGTFKFIKP